MAEKPYKKFTTTELGGKSKVLGIQRQACIVYESPYPDYDFFYEMLCMEHGNDQGPSEGWRGNYVHGMNPGPTAWWGWSQISRGRSLKDWKEFCHFRGLDGGDKLADICSKGNPKAPFSTKGCSMIDVLESCGGRRSDTFNSTIPAAATAEFPRVPIEEDIYFVPKWFRDGPDSEVVNATKKVRLRGTRYAKVYNYVCVGRTSPNSDYKTWQMLLCSWLDQMPNGPTASVKALWWQVSRGRSEDQMLRFCNDELVDTENEALRQKCGAKIGGKCTLKEIEAACPSRDWVQPYGLPKGY